MLTHDDSLAHLDAIQLTTALLRDDSALAKVCRAEVAAYHTPATADNADGEGKNKNLGPPHVYIATAGLAMLAAGGCSMEVGGLAGFKQAHDEVNILSKALSEADEAVASAMIPY